MFVGAAPRRLAAAALDNHRETSSSSSALPLPSLNLYRAQTTDRQQPNSFLCSSYRRTRSNKRLFTIHQSLRLASSTEQPTTTTYYHKCHKHPQRAGEAAATTTATTRRLTPSLRAAVGEEDREVAAAIARLGIATEMPTELQQPEATARLPALAESPRR